MVFCCCCSSTIRFGDAFPLTTIVQSAHLCYCSLAQSSLAILHWPLSSIRCFCLQNQCSLEAFFFITLFWVNCIDHSVREILLPFRWLMWHYTGILPIGCILYSVLSVCAYMLTPHTYLKSCAACCNSYNYNNLFSRFLDWMPKPSHCPKFTQSVYYWIC